MKYFITPEKQNVEGFWAENHDYAIVQNVNLKTSIRTVVQVLFSTKNYVSVLQMVMTIKHSIYKCAVYIYQMKLF